MNRLALVLLAFLLSGCIGTSSNIRVPYVAAAQDRFSYVLDNHGGMTPEGREILESRLRQQLGGQLGEGPDAKRINIRVNYYRMRNGATRFLVGVMAGRDRIQSTVTVTSADGTPLGTIEVDSANSTAMGTGRGLIQGHADEIAAFVKGGVGARVVSPTHPASTNPTPAGPACKACAKIGG